jgi:hypothetical protein
MLQSDILEALLNNLNKNVDKANCQSLYLESIQKLYLMEDTHLALQGSIFCQPALARNNLD